MLRLRIFRLLKRVYGLPRLPYPHEREYPWDANRRVLRHFFLALIACYEGAEPNENDNHSHLPCGGVLLHHHTTTVSHTTRNTVWKLSMKTQYENSVWILSIKIRRILIPWRPGGPNENDSHSHSARRGHCVTTLTHHHADQFLYWSIFVLINF